MAENFDGLISKLGNISNINYTTSRRKSIFFRGSNEYFLVAERLILKEVVNWRRTAHTRVFKPVQKKLSMNVLFNAPEQVVLVKKKKDALAN